MGPLDKFKPVHAAPTETGAGGTPEESVEQPLEAYSASLKGYVEKRRELHEYRRRNEAVLSDPEIFKESLLLDREVNHAHENLKDAGKIVGKNEYDIIVDILRQEGNLSEAFGLPEFCILTTNDVFLGNAGGEQFVPRGEKIPRRKLENIPLKTGTDEDNRFFTKDDALIVFEVVLYEGKGSYYDEWVIHAPDSYAREHRARALAEKLDVHTRWFADAEEEMFHAHRISLGGVTIKKKDIGLVAATIRENPKLYRLGKEFYTEEEIKKNDEEFEKSLTEAYKAMGKYGNYEQNARMFLARIRQVYGAGYSRTAQEVYDRWVVTKRERDGY